MDAPTEAAISADATPERADGPGSDDADDGRGGRTVGPFGPATWMRALTLAVAFAFLGGAVGWAFGSRDRDPFNDVDVGFMQDMTVHHEQAVQMSKILLYKTGIDRSLRSFAEEFLGDQRFEQGIFNALLVRFDHPVTNPDETAMGWMGTPVPVLKMSGMATEAQLDKLRSAQGRDAEALFIAMMSEHHLGGFHMSDYAARHGKDRTVRNIARAILRNQRGEIFDLARTRVRLDLPIPSGYTDPTKDQRLNPLSTNHD
ncbi:MAG: DUF305 domain-containing protein [Acidimicrobiales bacterium]|nr:DUF305 domain-containing protein [Acidimicrobiales bacterium]